MEAVGRLFVNAVVCSLAHCPVDARQCGLEINRLVILKLEESALNRPPHYLTQVTSSHLVVTV